MVTTIKYLFTLVLTVVAIVLGKVLYDVTLQTMAEYSFVTMLITLFAIVAIVATMVTACLWLSVTMFASLAETVMRLLRCLVDFKVDTQIKLLSLEREKLAVTAAKLSLQTQAMQQHLVTLSDKQFLFNVATGEVIQPLGNGSNGSNSQAESVTQCLLPSLNNDSDGILLGHTVDSKQEIRRELTRYCHFLAVGQSGSGKSVLALELAYNAVLQDAELAIVDIEGITFNAVKSKAIAYCDTVESAKALLDKMVAVIEERKQLFAGFPKVDKLAEYNQVATVPIKPIVIFLEEFTALMAMDKTIESSLKIVLLRGRKYGVLVFAFAQSIKYDVLDTTLRGQFNTRVILRAEDSAARVVLGDGVKSIDTKSLADGEGFVKFADYALPLRFRSVYRSKDDIWDAVESLSTVASGKVIDVTPKPDTFEQQVIDLAKQGKTPSQINKELGLTIGGKQNQKIKAILDKWQQLSV
jgi:hypothetical protein